MSETSPAEAAGPGTMLRTAREEAGVHIASLAAVLKVPVARLEALEADRYDLLPDLPFVRALAGSVCRALKVDPRPVLALLPQKSLPRLGGDVPRTDGATFRTTPAAPASLAGIGSGLRHPVVWVVGVLLLAAAALLLVPSARLGEWVQAVIGSRAAPGGQGSLFGGDAASDTGTSEPPVAAVTPTRPETADIAGNPSPAPVAAAAAPVVPAGVGTAPAAVSSSAASPSAAPSAMAGAVSGGLVSFNANAPSWVRVTDGRGKTVFEKLVQPGAPMNADGSPPLTVVVGNAAATSVQVRGQAFDLSAITRNNVARFEVR